MKRLLVLFGALSVFSAGAAAEKLTLIHGINGEDLGFDKALPVDIRLGYRCIAKNVTFGTVAQGIHVRPGLYTLRVTLANPHRPCRGTRVISERLTVNFGDSLSVIAHETDDGTIRATSFVNDLQGVGDNADSRVTVRHTANAPAVAILVNGGVAFDDLSNGDQGKTEVPAGLYGVDVAPAGTTDPVNEDPIPLPVNPDTNTIVYAVGSLANGTFQVLVEELDL